MIRCAGLAVAREQALAHPAVVSFILVGEGGRPFRPEAPNKDLAAADTEATAANEQLACNPFEALRICAKPVIAAVEKAAEHSCEHRIRDQQR